ncbi:MAG TPA: 1,4-dihydroxy-2-naphthoate polyprenyltransferase [Rhodothermales bacterium]|nr:1,4-dihydroxy-2-naphthoate polyprenyltransferase [Rhodothermales bacterium]
MERPRSKVKGPSEAESGLGPRTSDPGPLRLWWLAARPRTLPAAVAPVLIGTAMATVDDGFHAPSALVAVTCALLFQVGANFVNDLADARKGADTEARKGPVRVVSAGLVSERAMMRAIAAVFVVAFVLGLYLVWRGGWSILAVGLASIAAAIAYTAGKRALGYLGLGDLFVLVFFGPVAVAGTYYVQTLAFSWTTVLAGVGPGLLAVAILVANNLRDVDEDRAAGKRTLIVRFGERFGQRLFAFCHVVPAFLPLLLWALTGRHFGACAAALVLPLSMKAIRAVRASRAPEVLIPVLVGTGKRLFGYAVLFSLGWLLT